ncbi:MAG: TonB-dependent receptor [Spongiibacteraceae bacterium]|nr:TonB-dependent receptor [Spongiibacteraceae bacterium]
MKIKEFCLVYKILLIGMCVAAANRVLVTELVAQENRKQTADVGQIEEVLVRGIRKSLMDAAAAKRDSINVIDSVFSEDIGKFADLNIAEAVNRVPGMQIIRDVDGSGVNISIRGLGTDFTKILMNGAPIAVASSSRTDSQNGNREVDLNLFPTELFSQLSVNKTSMAHMIEGGVSGTVDMRTLRAFDNPEPGFHFTYQLQGGYGELSEQTSPRAAMIGSWSDDTYGVLVGVTGANNTVVTEGFETFGWTNANLRYNQCGITPPSGANPDDTAGGYNNGQCNSIGGDGFSIPRTVPTGVGNGLTSGDVIDRQLLLALNPGLSIDQISNALIPRIGRPHYSEGDRDNYSTLIALEARPNDFMNFNLDILHSESKRETNRLDMMLVGRNSALIPMNMQVDNNNVVKRAEFANAQFFLEARLYDEELDYTSISPSAEFVLSDNMHLQTSLYYSESDWYRVSPTIGVTTNLGQGVTAIYSNQGGETPQVSGQDGNGNVIDLNDTKQIAGWGWERAYVSAEKRATDTAGFHVDLRVGDLDNNINLGVHYDESSRYIVGLSNTQAYENLVCRGDLDDSGERPACRGGDSALIPNSQLSQYLLPSDAGFISVDYNKLFAATNYRAFLAKLSTDNGTSTGARSGLIDEKSWGFYIESNTTANIAGREARINMGVRYISTDQLVAGPVSFQDDWQEFDTSYEVFLPSFNSALEVSENIALRFSASQTLTRANPTAMLPDTSLSDVSAQEANQGNPNLQPFKSTNVDVGGEWYTGDEGYVALTYFHKQIDGFTIQGQNTLVFNELGIPFDDLFDLQQDAINDRGGPNVATILVNQEINSDGILNLRGYELTWVQPLSLIFDGLGFSMNYTKIDQKSTGDAPAVLLATSPVTANFTVYYENDGFSWRASYSWYDEQYQSALGQNGIPLAQRFQESRGQWDMSAAYQFVDLPTSPEITLNVINFNSDPQRQIYSYSNAPYTYYDPGYSLTLGLRGKF